LTDTHEALRRYWPQEFTKRRKFDLQAENRPYLEWLSELFESFDDCDEDNDDSDHSSEVEEEDEASNQSIVRRFMIGMDEDNLSYPDQLEVVASFCEQACNKGVRPNKVRRGTVALLDDSTTSAVSKSDTFPMKQGHRCRPYPGPMTAQQLREELSNEVILILSSH